MPQRGPNIFSRAWQGMFSRRQSVEELPTLGPGGPPVGLVSPPSRRRAETHPLVGADVSRVDAAMRNAFDGRPQLLMDLLDDMQERDERVGPVCRTRTLAVQGRPSTVRPAEGEEDNPEVQRIAERCQRLVRRIRTSEGGGWRSVIGQAVDGPLRGYAVFEKEWAVSTEGWHYPGKLHWRHPNRFIWDDELRLRLYDPGTKWEGIPLDQWGPHKFAVHSPMAGRASYPTRRGVMLGMIFPSLASRYGLRWWIKATEKWGSPIPHVQLPEGEGDDKAANALNLIRKMMADWAFVSWGDVKVDVLSGTGSLNPEVFEKLVGRAATSIAIHGLGQNMTTEIQGGSFAAAKVSNLIRLDILAGDLVELDDWVTSQVIDDIIHFNWPGMEGSVRYVTEIEERGDPTVEDVREGIFAPDERRSSLGFGPKPEGEGAEFRRPPVTGGTPPALPPPPEGGADEPDPFDLTRVKKPGRPGTSPTSERWTTGPARSLFNGLAG